MLKKITKWETEDGKVFDTQEEAEDYMFEQEKEVMTQSTEQPEALRLAGRMEWYCISHTIDTEMKDSAKELRRLHARVQELEAEKARLIEAYVPCPSATEAHMYGITQEKEE